MRSVLNLDETPPAIEQFFKTTTKLGSELLIEVDKNG